MRNIGKRLICAFVILMLSAALTGCGANICDDATDTLKAILERDSDMFEDNDDISKKTIEYLDSLEDNKVLDAITDHAVFEISDKDVRKDGGITVCEVELRLPEYTKILEEADYKLDDYIDLIENEDEDDYISVDLELEFDKNGTTYQILNGDDVVKEIYKDMVSVTDHIADESEAVLSCPIIYEDNLITMRFKGAVEDGVHFLVRNNSDQRMWFNASYLSINGRSSDDIKMEGKAPERSDVEIIAKCNIGAFKKVGLFSASFSVNGERLLQSYDINIENLVIDPGAVVDKPELKGTVVYEDDTLRVAFARLEQNAIVFNVENLTDQSISICPDSLAINSEGVEELEKLRFCTIPALSICEAKFTGKIDPETAVGTLSGHFDGYGPKGTWTDTHFEFVFDSVVDESLISSENSGGFIVYEDDLIRIYYKEVTNEGVVLQVANQTEFSLNLVVDCFAVNRHSYNELLCVAQIAPHSSGKATVKCDWDPEAPVGEISASFRATFDGENTPDTYRITVDSCVVDQGVEVTDVEPEAPLLFEDENLKISFNKCEGKYVYFEVENLSDIAVAMQSNLIILNDKKYIGDQIVMSSDVAPHSTGLVRAKIETLDVDSVQKVGGSMKVVDVRHYESYEVEFTETVVQ